MQDPDDATFVMITCAHGAETAVKASMAQQGWRLAFSRPGFVTGKHDGRTQLPKGIFIRTASLSIGQTRNVDGPAQLDGLRDRLQQSPLATRPFDQLHVWSKDRAPIGRFGFEPGIDEVARAVAETTHAALATQWVRCDGPNRIAQPGESVLDIVLVDPSHWFIGTHVAADWPTRWPGGVQPIEPDEEPVSRAYFKAAEAITWSGFPVRPGDVAIEIGSAPGGACGRLLELGLQVVGIDPAEMDPRIAEHPNFRHLRARAGDLPRSEFRGAKWLLVDSNVKPTQTMTTVGNVVNHRQSTLEGLLITMKIGDYRSAQLIDGWIERVESWKPKMVRVRQLARNKCEVCFAVTMK